VIRFRSSARIMRAGLACAIAIGVLAISACSGTGAAPTRPPAASPTAQPYSSKAFLAPLTIDVPADLGLPTPDSANLLTWSSKKNDNDRVRFLIPVVYYPAGPGPAEEPPTDWNAYFDGLAAHGLSLTNTVTVTVDGTPTKVQTGVGSDVDLDGSLGCPAVNSSREDSCFGFGSELAIRFAVLHDGDTPVLVWARTDSQRPTEDFLAQFDRILSTVKFR
jgi:hypothetical protein